MLADLSAPGELADVTSTFTGIWSLGSTIQKFHGPDAYKNPRPDLEILPSD